MNYEIRQVANGFIVCPTYSMAHDRGGLRSSETDLFVFATWELASAWLAEKFAGKP